MIMVVAAFIEYLDYHHAQNALRFLIVTRDRKRRDYNLKLVKYQVDTWNSNKYLNHNGLFETIRISTKNHQSVTHLMGQQHLHKQMEIHLNSREIWSYKLTSFWWHLCSFPLSDSLKELAYNKPLFACNLFRFNTGIYKCETFFKYCFSAISLRKLHVGIHFAFSSEGNEHHRRRCG